MSTAALSPLREYDLIKWNQLYETVICARGMLHRLRLRVASHTLLPRWRRKMKCVNTSSVACSQLPYNRYYYYLLGLLIFQFYASNRKTMVVLLPPISSQVWHCFCCWRTAHDLKAPAVITNIRSKHFDCRRFSWFDNTPISRKLRLHNFLYFVAGDRQSAFDVLFSWEVCSGHLKTTSFFTRRKAN